ncbi:UNVERIFIED_CONTAM: hypothetical protein ABIC26_003006 [Paenibacillus sp. PvR008]
MTGEKRMLGFGHEQSEAVHRKQEIQEMKRREVEQ